MEDRNLLSVYRRERSSQPLRYAPIYLQSADTIVRQAGHGSPPEPDSSVHQSYLRIRQNLLTDGRAIEDRADANRKLSFKLAERGRYEAQIASLIGGYDTLLRLASVHDDIVHSLVRGARERVPRPAPDQGREACGQPGPMTGEIVCDDRVATRLPGWGD